MASPEVERDWGRAGSERKKRERDIQTDTDRDRQTHRGKTKENTELLKFGVKTHGPEYLKEVDIWRVRERQRERATGGKRGGQRKKERGTEREKDRERERERDGGHRER